MVAASAPQQHADEHATHTQDTKRLELPVDAEHSGIRAAGCLTFIALFFAGIGLTLLLIPGGGVIGLLVGLALAAVGAQQLDRYLQGRWPSGRKLIVNDERILLSRNDKIERQINPQQQVNPLMWCFTVRRSGRVKKGWHVVALSLQQDDAYVPIYTFVPPDELDNLPLAERFEKLQRPSKVDTKSESSMKLAGQQRRLHEAEQDRGWDGAELTREQFVDYIQHLQQHYKWMPKS